jgi:hypothetical protein
MSVVRQDPDLQDAFNELEAKVLIMQEEHKKLRRRVTVLESLAKKHGVTIDNKVELDTCIIV